MARQIGQAYHQPKLTEDQKQKQIMLFLQQKRESFALNILCSLLHNNPGIHPDDVIGKAVDLADKLLNKLYPLEDKYITNNQ